MRTITFVAKEAHMPLVHISLRKGKPPAYVRAIADGVFEAMLKTINVPADDRFQVITELPADRLIYDAGYLGVRRTDDVVFIEVTLNQGRTLELKKAFYARIAENLAKNPGMRKEDVLVNLVEVPKENWSFGNGIAQYAG